MLFPQDCASLREQGAGAQGLNLSLGSPEASTWLPSEKLASDIFIFNFNAQCLKNWENNVGKNSVGVEN